MIAAELFPFVPFLASIDSPALLHAILVYATPLIVAALGELVVERAGVVNIGIEGMMLAGALAAWGVDGFLSARATTPAVAITLAIAAAMFAAIILALPFALATLLFAADQIVTATGINLLSLGVTGVVYQLARDRFAIADVHGLATGYLIAFSPMLAAMLWAFFRFTRPGLELAAIGESPRAADTAGLAVLRRQFFAILFGAACAGLAGSFLSIMYNRVFTENMTDGVGFLALAIVIFGRWNAAGIFAAGIFFGLVRACADILGTMSGYSQSILQLFNMLPYVVSIAALAGVTGKSGAPAALGRPYVRE